MKNNCKKGYKISLADSHKRCKKIINRYSCKKQGKQFSTKTKKCRIPCRPNEQRVLRSDKRSTKCRLRCKKNQERGSRYCRRKCSSKQKRVKRGDGRGTRCVNK